ncbi:hypothetical protein C1752_04542 [Acaryochloris thomasi RCC1774]|uniref:Uncharacterized protein n=1 Tax=Acaryochloris thomasi RCC1774 TaxID=1764569 RepID=A0A2W1JD86_9CYAN|nr:hypothetical protein [Acaryochloris thomasi]PZD71819.1 hypothetical protein C1752_04542 [Acaryochloris thomasi RCC1774]
MDPEQRQQLVKQLNRDTTFALAILGSLEDDTLLSLGNAPVEMVPHLTILVKKMRAHGANNTRKSNDKLRSQISDLKAEMQQVKDNADPELRIKADKLDAELDERMKPSKLEQLGRKIYNAIRNSDHAERKATLAEENLVYADDHLQEIEATIIDAEYVVKHAKATEAANAKLIKEAS